ncbi:hypothetical protein D3C72_2034900 [compost metagenome]
MGKVSYSLKATIVLVFFAVKSTLQEIGDESYTIVGELGAVALKLRVKLAKSKVSAALGTYLT